MPKLTLKLINAALAERGHAEQLVKGRGYFYFVDGTASSWFAQGVYVYRLTDLTLEDWLKQRDYLANY